MQIRFTLQDQSLGRAIDRALAAAKDFSPAMAEIAQLLEAEIRQRFEDGQGPDGEPWKTSKRAREEGGKTLVDTAALLSSIASRSDATSAEAGTNLVYAAIHQFGGTIRPKRKRALATPFGPLAAVEMPARPFLGFGDAERAEIPRILADHLRDAFEARA
ncbi:MAG: phage virion morphogenesis protein [Sphingomonadaceae bacterium]